MLFFVIVRQVLTLSVSRIREFLDGGIASSSRLDGLGKGIGEYLRSRVVDIPERFLARGSI
jgi:hypothetical protein